MLISIQPLNVTANPKKYGAEEAVVRKVPGVHKFESDQKTSMIGNSMTALLIAKIVLYWMVFKNSDTRMIRLGVFITWLSYCRDHGSQLE